LGQRLREILLDHRSGRIDPFLELLLYEASRAILVQEKILPALTAGKVVVVDRFQDSTWVYQGWAGGMDLRLVEELGRCSTGNRKPDRTILLDLPVKKGLARVRRPNRMETKSVRFHEKVRQGYLALARREPKRFRVIRADQPASQVERAIQKEVKNLLR
jgi:dTMP kinase